MVRKLHLFAVIVVVALTSSPGAAQGTGDGFLFGRPQGTLTIRAGYDRATASSNLFSFTSNQLTLNKAAFSSPVIEADLALRLGERTDLVFASAYSGLPRASEFRDFVEQNGDPIRQTTTFRRVPVTMSVRQYLTSPGRSVGSLAWIPARIAPYIGAGGGAIWYDFQQNGDFVDVETNNIFSTTMKSTGWTPAAQAFGGVDFTLTPRLALTAQGKYLWAKGRLGGDFSGFDRIDLGGLSTTVGLSVRF